MSLIDDIKRDRAGMQDGQWEYQTGPALKGNFHTVVCDGEMVCECWDGEEITDATNARRIARVPALEAALLAAEELAAEIEMNEISDAQYICWNSVPMRKALAAYRKATGDA